MTYIKMTIMVGTFCVRNIHIILHILILSCLPFVFLLLFFFRRLAELTELAKATRFVLEYQMFSFIAPDFDF